jgi:hypothetical protein
LRVRAREESEARHASTLLADALRTASLPIADQGQLLLVRKLSLGRISSFGSSATVALQFERAMREARSSAVHFDSPAAPTANAVIFPSRAEALAALARSHARRAEPREWFWSAALPGWAAPLSRPGRWRLLLEAAHELREAAVASAEIVRVALSAGAVDELLNALGPGQGAQWLQLEGWSWPPAAGFPESSNALVPGRGAQWLERKELNTPPPALLPDDLEIAGSAAQLPFWRVRHHQDLECARRAWGENSDRMAWLATMLAVAENPARAAEGGLVAATMGHLLAREEIGRPKREMPRGNSGPPLRPHRKPEKHASEAEAIRHSPGLGRSPSRSDEIDGADSSEISSAKEIAHARPALESALGGATEAQPEQAFSCPHAFTSFAGLLFLVPILERLGFAEFLATNPSLLESEFPPRLLRFVGARVGMLPEDALALAFDCRSESEPVFRHAGLPKGAREILAHPRPRTPLDSPLMSWTTALRRWSRRHAGLGLRSLLCRAGRVARSPTQLDIFFDLNTVDLRLRRLALDVDPGWVPWLGRVVRFHYLEPHERDF